MLSTGLAPARRAARAAAAAALLPGGLPARARSSPPGSVSAPRAAGHLEIRAPEPEGARARAPGGPRRRASPLQVSVRRGHAVAYAKSKQTIRELLAHMGAHDAVLSLDEAEVISRTRERANRATNCDEANLARQGSAARAQAEAIAALDIDALELRPAPGGRAAPRHPDLSLAELGRRARPPLSKSTVAGRMRLLVSAAELGYAGRRPTIRWFQLNFGWLSTRSQRCASHCTERQVASTAGADHGRR